MDHKAILEFLKTETKALEGTFIEYNESSVMLTVPVDDTRFQNVKGYLEDEGEELQISFMSKICKYEDYPNLDYQRILRENYRFKYSRIIIYNEYIQLYATETYNRATLEHAKEMFLEVAKMADYLEHELTGEDFH